MRIEISSGNAVRLLVTTALVLTLVQYFTILPVGGIVPIVVLYVSGLIALLRTDRSRSLRQILSAGSVLFPFLVFSEVVSYYSGWSYSIQYGLVLLLLFCSIRLILLQIGLFSVVRCYINSAVICTLVLLISGKQQITEYQVGQVNRFDAGSAAHPNLLGFTVVSYLPLFLGVYLDTQRPYKRYFFLFLILSTLGLLFLAGSRGSLGAVIVAAVILLLRFTTLNPLINKWKVKPLSLVAVLVVVALTIGYFSKASRLLSLGDFFVTALSLNSRGRGIHSGFSGRTEIWVSFLHRINGLQWLFGLGYRQAYLVDNGYITVLFDNGLVGLAVILGSILKVLHWLWGGTKSAQSWGWWRYRVALLTLVIAYLVNCFTARYLFSYGNQFSLLVLFMMLSSREDLLGGKAPQVSRVRVARTVPPGLAIPTT